MHKAELRPLDLEAAMNHVYDPTHYQSVLFCADSFDEMYEMLRGSFCCAGDEALIRASVLFMRGHRRCVFGCLVVFGLEPIRKATICLGNLVGS
jgi:hypothetical protein